MISVYAFILIAVLAIWLALCLHNRYFALVAFVALLPIYLVRVALPLPGTGINLPTTLLELFFLILFSVWLFTDAMRPGAWRALREWAMPISLFVAGATISVAVAPSFMPSLGLWRAYIVEPILFFAMFSDIIGRKKRGVAVLCALGTTLAIVGIIAVYQKITGFGIPNPIWAAEATRRATAFYGFPNAIGLFAAPVTMLMVAWAVSLLGQHTQRRWLALLPTSAAILGALGILFAVSEGAAIGLLAGLGLYGLMHKKLRPWTLGAIIIACAVVVLIPPVRNYASLLVSLRDDSGSVRSIIWSETSAMLADHPVFGTGLAGYPGRILPYHRATWIEVFQYPHDIVLNFWGEVGLLGLAGFVWIVWRFYAVTLRVARTKDAPWLAAGLIAAMTATLVHGLVDVPYFKNDLAMLFWVLIGLAEVLRRIHLPTEGITAKVKKVLTTGWAQKP